MDCISNQIEKIALPIPLYFLAEYAQVPTCFIYLVFPSFFSSKVILLESKSSLFKYPSFLVNSVSVQVLSVSSFPFSNYSKYYFNPYLRQTFFEFVSNL